MLPDVLRDDIEPLFDYLRKKRSKVLQEVTNELKSKEYLQILRDWEKFLNAPRQDSATASKADRPVIDLARKKIYKKYRSIVKAGSMPLGNAEDDMLHALRIECKKLRYLIEFFASLFSRKKIDVLIEQLKQMQDNLGYYNDLRVQEKYLLNITAEIPKTGQQSKKVLVVIGSLIGTLSSEKQKVKETLGKTFTDFTSATNARLFRELCALRQQEAV
jgi:CHAD domain-containing protein